MALIRLTLKSTDTAFSENRSFTCNGQRLGLRSKLITNSYKLNLKSCVFLSQFFRTFKSGLSEVYQAFFSCKKLKVTSLSFLLKANAHKELQLW